MAIGLVVGPLLTGISTAWWKRNHNAHHVVTNSVTHDPGAPPPPAPTHATAPPLHGVRLGKGPFPPGFNYLLI
jgi:hypothetical protein